MKKIFLILLFGFSFVGFSQITDFETQTYKLYIDQNWESLIKVANRAKEQKSSSYVIALQTCRGILLQSQLF